MAFAISREGGDGRSHHCRISDLHDLRRRLSLLLGKESDGADTARCPRDADLLHGLFVVQQFDDSLRREVSGTRHYICFPCILAADRRTWWIISLRHGSGMAPADLRTRTDDLDQPVRNDLLLTRRLARVSRHRRTDHAHDRSGVRTKWSCG